MNIQKKNYTLIATAACFVVLFCCVVCLGVKLSHTNKKLAEMSKQIQYQFSQNSKIYTYDLQKVATTLNIAEKKQQYEADIIQLNNDLVEAEKKIKTLKDAKVKEDFAEVYLKNLKMKRDEIVKTYENSMQELTMKLNKAMEDVVREKNIPMVYFQSALAVKTPHTVDVTADVLQKLKN
ncbi:MAG: hypothetical protein J5896_01200 [Alphaproteobacteria bacterium]|nr:hypothetical protein [Alphaproteobacteria bacterium]